MYSGFFLNLATNNSRRYALLKRLKAIGGDSLYQRVDAINGREIANQYTTTLDPGALGLWLTHVNLIRAQMHAPHHLHVLEDDVMLADNAIHFFDQMLAHADAALGDWDLIFTDILVKPDANLFHHFLETITQFKKSGLLTLTLLEHIPFAGTSSIFVRRQSLGKYLAVIDQGWNKNMPIDLYLRQAVSKRMLNAYVTTPFLTSPGPLAEQSDIRGKLSDSRLAIDLYRRAFFKDADLVSLDEQLRKLLVGAKVDPMKAIFLNAASFMSSDQWEGF